MASFKSPFPSQTRSLSLSRGALGSVDGGKETTALLAAAIPICALDVSVEPRIGGRTPDADRPLQSVSTNSSQ